MSDVFIGFAEADRDIAEQIAHMLRQNGVSVFMDHEALVSGTSSSEQTTEQLAKSQGVFVILTKNSARSKWVSHELAHALRAGGESKLIVPILVGEGSTDNLVWPLVADRQHIEAGEEFGEDDLRKIDRLIPQLALQPSPTRAAVFLGYAEADAAVAEQLRDKLADRGLSCFMAGASASAADDPAAVSTAMKGSTFVMILLTPLSVEQDWVLLHAGAAWALNKKVIPVLKSVDEAELPPRLEKLQTLHIENDSQMESLLDELAVSAGRTSR